jgi:hypothetical protein
LLVTHILDLVFGFGIVAVRGFFLLVFSSSSLLLPSSSSSSVVGAGRLNKIFIQNF